MGNAPRVSTYVVTVNANGHVLCLLNATGPYSGKWEFPSTDVRQFESPRHAALRSLKDQLGITGVRLLPVVSTPRPDGSHMQVYMCTDIIGDIKITLAHSGTAWIDPAKLGTSDFPVVPGCLDDKSYWMLNV